MNPNPQPPFQPQMQQPPQQPPGFFKRNWKWLVPVGCIAPFLCCGAFGAVTYFGVSAAIKSSGAYVQALGNVVGNDEVKAALGEPVTPGFGISGEIKEDLGGGSADFSVPLTGPKGKGTLRVVGRKTGSTWSFSKMQVETESGKTIDVLGGKGAAPDPTEDIEPDQVRDPAELDEPLVEPKDPPEKE